MPKPSWRYPASVWPGLLISISLIGLAISLFGSLYSFSHTPSLSQIDSRIWYLFGFSIYQAFLSTLFSILLGVLLAWSLAHQRDFLFRDIIIALFSSSLVLPTLIVAFGLISVLGNNGWLNHLMHYFGFRGFGSWLYGLKGILIAHTYLNASFAARSLLHSFESIPPQRYKLSASLGLSLFKRFKVIEWPAIKGNIASISLTIFMLCFNSFAIVLLLGGSPSYNTLEVAIYEAIKIDFDIPFALKLAMLQLSFSALLVILSASIKSKTTQLQTNSKNQIKQGKLINISQKTAIFLFATAYILPLMAIVVDGLHSDLIKIFHQELFIRSLYISIAVGFVSALLSVSASLTIANSRRSLTLSSRAKDTLPNKILSYIIAFGSNLYLSIPSLIMGFGFFMISRLLHGSLNSWAVVALLSANVLMSLPFALSNLYPAMQKNALKYDKLALSLSLNMLQRWKYIEWPHLRGIIGYIFALSFALSLGDLGVIALFGNDKITTLPWYLYQLMGSYHNSDASGVALVLLTLVLVVFLAMAKIIKQKSPQN